MCIRFVRMCVLNLDMGMSMRMHGFRHHRAVMRVLMVWVGVAMRVGVRHGSMAVQVLMLLAREERCGEKHQRQGGKERPLRELRKDSERQQYTGERRDTEQRARPSRAETSEGENEQHDAHPVADASNSQCREDLPSSRKRASKCRGKSQGEASGSQPLDHDDPCRIAQRDPLCEVVVESPHQAGAEYEKRARRYAPPASEVER